MILILGLIFFSILLIVFTPLGAIIDYKVFIQEEIVDVKNVLVEKYPETHEFRIEIYNEGSETPEYVIWEIDDDYTFLHYKEGEPVNIKFIKLVRRSTGEVENYYYFVEKLTPPPVSHNFRAPVQFAGASFLFKLFQDYL